MVDAYPCSLLADGPVSDRLSNQWFGRKQEAPCMQVHRGSSIGVHFHQ